MNIEAAPLVSVCIPTFNRAQRLLRAVQHILASTYAPVEILISDNASTDATQEVCRRLCEEHPNIRYHRHAVNRGPTRNFEYARSMAVGKYFLWHGDDDYLAADYIDRCVAELEKDASLVLVSGLGAYHRGDGIARWHGNVVQHTQRNALLRALYFIWTVEEASVFCGVYRRADLAACKMPNCLAGDHVWLSEVLLTGKAVMLPDTYVFKEEWENTSSTAANIVRILELPRWHARIPWIAIPNNLASDLATDSPHYRNSSRPKQMAVFCIVFAVAFVRQWIYAAIVRARRWRKLVSPP